MCRVLSKRITTLLLVIILCITLNICAVAASDSDDIKFDGYVCEMEWGRNNKVNYKNQNYGNNISFANIYVISDEKKGVLCLGFNIAEKNDYNSRSGVEIIINSTKKIKISGENYCKNDSDLHVESKARRNMANSYNLEIKIWYSSLNSGTTLSVSFIDCNNCMSNRFYIDRKNMTADIFNTPVETTKKSSSTQKHTTKKKTTTKSKHKNSSSNNKEKGNNDDKDEEKDKNSKNGDSNYVYQHTTKEEPRGKKSSGGSKIKTPKCNSPNNNDGVHVKSGPNDNNNIVEEVLPKNKSEGNFKVKKVVITTVASAMIITAVSLPVIKNNKDKKQDDKKE